MPNLNRYLFYKKILALFLCSALYGAGVGIIYAQQESATLNLDDADIRVLINTVSEATGKNFIIDPRVKARVTVVSSKSMTKDEIYEVFLSILQVHGFAAIPTGNIIKIVPEVNAKQSSIPFQEPASEEDQLVTQVLVVENVEANQLVPILRPLVPQQGHLAAYSPTNVLVITDRASNIDRMVTLVRRIDRPDNDEIEIIKLENASAAELVRILSSLRSAGGPEDTGRSQPILTADERTNSILLGGDKSARLRIRGIIAQLDVPLDSVAGNTRVVFLKYAEAKSIATILQAIPDEQAIGGTDPSKTPPKKSESSIQADEDNNALVITATPSVIRQLEDVIRQLDIPRAQVLIEAIIAEVSNDLAAELGTQFLFSGAQDGSGPIAGGIFSGATSILGLLENPPILSDGLTMVAGNIESSNPFAFVLSALEGDASTNILATPTLVTLDNIEAEIVFGQNVPFVTGSFTNTGAAEGSTNPFQTIERQDVGLTLKVKPQINEGNAVKMEIDQEISSIGSSAQVTSDVVTNKRSIVTQVLVEDGQIVVLGGLLQDQFTDSKQKIPVIGSIPVLGRLFSYNQTQKITQNLMVFIRPSILTDIYQINYFTSEKYKLLQAKQIEAKLSKRGLLDSSDLQFPEIELLFSPRPAKPAPVNSTPSPDQILQPAP